MPIALVAIGLILVITGVKNTYAEFGALVKGDFTGQGNFTTWMVAIGIIGALGYVKALKPFANGFLVLVAIVIVLKNGGVFDKLKSALATGPTSTPGAAPPIIPQTADSTGKSGTSNLASNVIPFAAALALG